MAAAELGPVLLALLSINNDERRAAESALETALEDSCERVIETLLVVCGGWAMPEPVIVEADPAVRSLCAVLLRRHLVRGWTKLSVKAQSVVMETLLGSLKAVSSAKEANSSKLGECAAALAGFLIENNDEEGGLLAVWSELAWVAVEAVDAKKSVGLDLVYRLAQHLDEPSGTLRTSMAEALRNQLAVDAVGDVDMVRRATRALGAVLRYWGVGSGEANSCPDPPAGCVEALIFGAIDFPCSMHQVERSHDIESALRSGLEALIEVAEWRPEELRPVAGLLAERCTRLAVTCGQRNIAGLSLEVVASLAEAAPGMARKAHGETKPLAVLTVEACLQLLCQTHPSEHTPEALQSWSQADTDDRDDSAALIDDDDAESCYALRDLGGEVLDRICRALGPKATLPVAAEGVRQLIAAATESPSNAWPQGRAAFTALIQIAESLWDLEIQGGGDAVPFFVRAQPKILTSKKKKRNRKKNGESLESRLTERTLDLTETCLAFGARYPVAQVRREAMDALAQSATDMSPALAQSSYTLVFPTACEALRNEVSPRCRVAAARVLLTFLDDLGPSQILGEHMQSLVYALRDAIVPDSIPHCVRRVAVAALAALAAAVGDSSEGNETARALYALFGTTLKQLVASRRIEAGLRARSLECLALLGSAAGVEVFRSDATELARLATSEYLDDNNRRLEDDVERPAAMRCIVRLAKTLGSDFEPFLHAVLPPLLNAAAEPKTSLYEEVDDDDELSSVGEGTEMVVRTEALEEQEMACQLLRLLAEALGVGFSPYVEECLVKLGPVCSNSIDESIRVRAVAAVPQLVKCSALAGNQEQIQRACASGIGALLTALETEDDADTRLAILQALRHTIEDGARCWVGKQLGDDPLRIESANECVPILINTAASPSIISNALLSAERAMVQRRAMRLAQAAVDTDYDEERHDQDETTKQYEIQGHFHIAEVFGALLRTHGAIALYSILQNSGWPPRLRDMAQPACIEDDRCFAAYLLADFFDFGLIASTGHEQHQGELGIPGLSAILRAEPLELLLLLADGHGSAGRRQAAIFGLGRAALRCGPEALAHCLPRLLTLLITSLQNKSIQIDAQDDEVEDEDPDFEDDDEDADSATVGDNAAAALYHILRAHPASLSGDTTAWNVWLQYLPLLADAEEADVCARGLCHAIQDQALSSALIPEALAAIARILLALERGGYCGTTATDKPTATSSDNRLKRSQALRQPLTADISSALATLQARHPEELQLAFSKVPSHLQATLQRFSTGGGSNNDNQIS